jgi:hypothetical protein
MDPTRFAATLAVLLIGVGIGRVVIGSAGRTSDVMATLWVPPDLALGWPRGVQESDEPWGWHAPPVGPEWAPANGDDDDDTPPTPPGGSDWIDPPRGTFVVPVDRVDPVHLGVRPH